MKLRLHWAAAEEARDAYQHYEGERLGLGLEFLKELEIAMEEVRLHPGRWANYFKGTKHYRLSRFPYGIVYVVRNEEVKIIAVQHEHREPGYWARRLK